MRTFLQLIIFTFLLFSNSFAQFLDPPYKFEKKWASKLDDIYEGHFLPNIPTSYVLFNPNYETKNLQELKFVDRNLQVWNSYVLEKDVKVITNFFVCDYNEDGLDEMIIPVINGNMLNFHMLWVANGEIKNKIVYRMESYSDRYKGGFLYKLIQLNNSPEKELLVAVKGKYPVENSDREIVRREILAIDLNSSQKIWSYLTADYIKSFDVITSGNKPLIVYTSSSVENGMVLNKGKYSNYQSTGNVPHEKYLSNLRLYQNIKKDISLDSIAVVKAIDSNGRKVWARYLGNKFTWVGLDKLTIDDKVKLIISICYRDHEHNNDDKFLIIDPFNDGKVEKVINLNTNLTGSSLMPFFGKIVKLTKSNKLIEFNKKSLDYRTITPPFSEKINYLRTNTWRGKKIFFLRTPDKMLALNDEFEIIASSEHEGYKFKILSENDYVGLTNSPLKYAYCYQLVEVPFWERINSDTYILLTFSMFGLILVILTLWIITMNVSKKKILKQKNELEETTAKLVQSEKLAVLGTIASGVAHELNSPIGAILNSTQRVQNSKDMSSETVQKNLSLAESAAKKCKIIVEKFLRSSNPNKSSYITNVSEVINDWLTLFRKQFELLGIEIKIDVDENIFCNIGYTELNQVINNCMFNARDSLAEKSTDKVIQIKVSKKENVNILISDSGAGFPKEILNSNFTAFKTTKEKGKGTGLGLWVMNNLVKEADGNLQIYNDSFGANVSIDIPSNGENHEY